MRTKGSLAVRGISFGSCIQRNAKHHDVCSDIWKTEEVERESLERERELTAQLGAPAHHCADATAGAKTAATIEDFMATTRWWTPTPDYS